MKRMCTDPERVKNHALGTDGSCHTCAMALDSEFNLIEEVIVDPTSEEDQALEDAAMRDYRNALDYDPTANISRPFGWDSV